MEDNQKKYVISIPSEGFTGEWTQDMLDQKKDKLIQKYPDARIEEEMDMAADEQYDDNLSYGITLPDGTTERWTGAMMNEKGAKLRKKYPDARISKLAFWSDNQIPQDQQEPQPFDIGNANAQLQQQTGVPAPEAPKTYAPSPMDEAAAGEYRAEQKVIQDAQRQAEEEYLASLPDDQREYVELMNSAAGIMERLGTYRDRLDAEDSDKAALRRLRSNDEDALDKVYEGLNNNTYYKRQLARQSEDIETLKDRIAVNAPDILADYPVIKGDPYASRGPEGNMKAANLEAAGRFAEDARKAISAPLRYDDSKGLANYAKGVGSVLSDPDFWSMGITDVQDKAQLRAVLQKVNDAYGSADDIDSKIDQGNLDGILDLDEQYLLQSYLQMQDARSARYHDTSRGYKAGAGSAESAGFMLEMALTSGLGGAVKSGVTKGLGKWLLKGTQKIGTATKAGKIAKATSREAAKLVAGQTGNVLSAAARMPFMPSSYGAIAEQGTVVGDDGQLVSLGQAIKEGTLDNLTEVVTEGMGPATMAAISNTVGAAGLGTLLKKISRTRVGEFARKVANSPAYETMKKMGYDGLGEELLEEFDAAVIDQVRGNPEAIRDFVQTDNLLTTVLSFAPMTIMGGAVSTGQKMYAGKRLEKTAQTLRDKLIDAGYTQSQADYFIDVTRNSTPQEISMVLTPVLNQFAEGNMAGAAAGMPTTGDLFNAVKEYGKAVVRYQAFDGIYQQQEQNQRTEVKNSILDKTGDNFWVEYENGSRPTVETGTLADGTEVYVVSSVDENGVAAAITSDGKKMFVNAAMLPEGTQIRSLDEYLSEQVMSKKLTAEQKRIEEEKAARAQQVREQAQPGSQINLGTAEAPVTGEVIRQTPDGIIVQTENGVSLLSWDEAANAMNIGAAPLTDEQIEQQEVAQMEAADAEKDAAMAETEEEAVDAVEETEAAQQDEVVSEPLPVKADGSVDQTTLWNQSPERWAQWNDEQRQDGGANSLNYISGAIAKEQAKLDEMTAAYNAESDFDVRSAMEPELAESQDRIARLAELQQKYVPAEQIQEEVKEEAPAAEAQTAEETPAAPAAEPQPAEMSEDEARANEIRQTLYDLYNDDSLSEAEIEQYVEANVKGSQEDLDKHMKKAPQMGRDMAKYKEAKAAHEAKAEELRKQRDFWREAQTYVTIPEVAEADMEPQNALEFAARELSSRSGIKLQPESFKRHTGYGSEASKFLSVQRSKAKGGMTLEEAGERLMELDRENNTGFFDQNDPNAGLNAILDVIQSSATSGDLGSYIRSAREQAARQEVAAARDAMMAEMSQPAESGPAPAVQEEIAPQPPYELSDEVDANGRQFVVSPGGTISFGEITDDTGLTPAPILLSEGLITNPSTNDGYGLVHIEARHGDQIRNAGYGSVVEFIAEVASNYESIREGKNRDGHQTYMLQLTDRHNNTLMVELSGDGTYWNINTAGIFKTSYGANRKEVYNRHTTGKQSAETVEASQVAEQSDTRATSSMSAPTTSSDGKDNDYLQSAKQSEKKIDELKLDSSLEEDMPDFENMSDEEVVRQAVKFFTPEQELQRLEAVEQAKEDLDASYQQRLAKVDTRMAAAQSEEERRAVTDERAAVLQQYMDEISSEEKATVLTPYNYAEVMRADGCSEQSIREVEDAVNNPLVILGGFMCNGRIYVMTDVADINRARRAYVHERQHIRTRNDKGLIDRVLKAIPDRRTLLMFVELLSGTDDYRGYGNEVLADEIISFAMERAYSAEDFVSSLQYSGIYSQELLNIINDIINEQREDSSLSKARRREGLYSHERRRAQGAGRQNGGAQRAGSSEVAQQGSRSAEGSSERTVSKQVTGLPLPSDNRQLEGNVRFSKSSGTLVGMHNISEEKLRKVIRQGGSANPSTAVVDIARQSFDSYGDISLVMPSSLVDAGTGRNAGTFTADAWTPVYPQVVRRFSDDKLQRVYWKDISALPEEMQGEARQGFDGWRDDRNSAGLAYMFLHERGEAPELVRVEPRYPKELRDKISSILNDRTSFYQLSADEKQAVIDLYIEENFGGDRERFNQSIAERIRRTEDRLSKDNVPSFAKKRLTADLDWMKEHGYDYEQVAGFVSKVSSDLMHAGTVNDAATTNKALDYIKENGLSEEFERWKEGLAERYGIKEYLFAGYTPSGNQKWLPNTIENASRLMNKEGLAGSTGLSVSFSRFVATLAPKKKSLSDIRSAKDRLTEDADAVEEFREKWTPVYYDLGIKCQPDAERFEDYGLARLEEAAQKKNPGAYLKKEYGVELSQEDLQKLSEMIKAIKTEFPARYFETKFQRPVYLNEFAAAVMPTDTSDDIKQAVSEAGLPVFEYDPSVEGSRRDAALKASEVEGVRFQIGRAKDKVENLFTDAVNGRFKGKPVSIGTLTEEGKKYLESISGLTFKDKVDFVLNSSDLMHMYNEHFGANEKDPGSNIPLTIDDIRNIVDVILNPEKVLYLGEDDGKRFAFLAPADSGAYNLIEVYTTKKGNLSSKTFYKTKKGVSHRAMILEKESRHSTSETNGATLSDAKIPILFDIANKEESGVRFQKSNRNQAIFVSNAARAVEGIKQEKATPEQWLKMIEKAGGLKAGEDKWMGLSDWLKASDKKTLTKQEVLDFINENMIVIEEVHYVEGAEEDFKEVEEDTRYALQEIYDEYIAESEDMNDDMFMSTHYDYAIQKLAESLGYEAWNAPFVNMNATIRLDLDPDFAAQELNDIRERLGMPRNVKEENGINETRLGYTTRGLANNHEIALTVPTIESWNKGDVIHFGDAGDGRAVAWIRFGETEVPVQDAAYTRLQEIYDRLSELEMKVSSTGISHEEYEERARLREERNELQEIEPKTQQVLVIDEIQSKRHQEGREKGYKPDWRGMRKLRENLEKADKEVERIEAEMIKKYGSVDNIVSSADYDALQAAKEARREARLDFSNPHYGGIPDAPFDKNWHELAMKRMLRFAAENGYDVIAWTKGDQQAERYNIGSYVSSIEMQEEYDGKRDYGFYMGDADEATTVTVDENGTVVSAEGHLSQAEGRPLADLVGKEMAVKMMQMEEYDVLEDTDLKVGNEGMKGFYDRMLPAFMNKYGKKWGVKVEDIELPNLENGLTMHSVPVTEEMKESVMEGQVMFQKTGITSEVREEMDRISANAIMDGTYMQAPNGKPTNLTADQWALVRTEGFKRWFGDWELPYKTIDVVRGNMAHGFANFDEARQWAKDNIVRVYSNEETGGKGEIEISNNAVKKYLSGSAVNKSDSKDLHLAVLKVLPSVIRNGVIAETHADYMKDENGERTAESMINPDVTIHRVYGAVRIGNDIYRVKVTLKEHKDANRANTPHSYEATKIELLAGTLVGANGSNPNTNNSISAANLLNGVEKSYESGKYLLDDHSKVVDENGEPRVMYHGSDWQPLTESNGNAVFKMNDGMLGKGAYFASSLTEATLYAEIATGLDMTVDGNYEILQDEYVTDYFLNIRDEKDIFKFGDDDIIAVAKSPNQIKSATDNIGEFSAENPDIRFQIRRNEDRVARDLFKDPSTNHFFVDGDVDGFNSWLDEHKEDFVRLYHGTGGNIDVANQGLLKTTKKRRRSYQSTPGYVYLSLYPSSARLFGELGYPYEKAKVHAVDIKIKELKPDLDQLANKRLYDDDLSQLGDSLAESLIYGGGARVKRNILPDEISVDIRFSKTGTPTDKVVNDGLRLSQDESARLAGNIFEALPESARESIVEETFRNGFDMKSAIFQMSARLAEKEELTDEEADMAKVIAQQVEDAVIAGGVSMTRPLTTPEALWMLYRHINDSSDIIGAAREAMVADNLGFSPAMLKQIRTDENDIRFSKTVDNEAESIANTYNQSASYYRNRLYEVFVDQYDTVEALVKAIEAATGKQAKPFENIMYSLNQLPARSGAKAIEMTREYVIPMWDAIKSLISKYGLTEEDIARYTKLKHGLERNEEFPRRDAREFYRNAYNKNIASIEADKSLSDKEKKEKKEKAVKDLEFKLECIDRGSDAKFQEFRERDYSGIMAAYDDTYDNLADAEQAAKEEVKSFEAGKESEVNELWKRINALNKATLKVQYESGQMSKSLYSKLREQFKYYVPLRGFMKDTAEDLFDYYSHEFSGFEGTAIRAVGRKTEAESPFGHMAAMMSSAVVSGEKNAAKLPLYYFALNRKDNGLLMIHDVWYVKRADADEWQLSLPPVRKEGESMAEYGQRTQAWEDTMKTLQSEGNAKKGKQNLSLEDVVHIEDKSEREHYVRVLINGQEKWMVVNGNPRAAQAINGLLNVESDPYFSKFFGKVMRELAQMSTSYNPEFWMTNLERDIMTTFATVYLSEDKEYREAFLKNYRKAWSVLKLLPKLKDGTLGDTGIEGVLKEAAAAGLQTGFSHIKANEIWDKEMDTHFKDVDAGKAKKAIKAALGRLANVSESMELVSRFAVFMTSRQLGRSIEESVADGKEVTANFNRKGSGRAITLDEAKKLTTADGRTFREKHGEFWGAIAETMIVAVSRIAQYGRKHILFFNASIQGLDKWMRLARKKKGNAGKLAAYFGGQFALGFVMSLLYGLDDDDEYQENLSDYDRRNNIMIGGNGYFIKIVLPHDVRAFYGMGDILYNYLSGNYKYHTFEESVATISRQLLSLSPVNVNEGWQGLLPDWASPIIEAGAPFTFLGLEGTNKNFAGMPIRKETPWLTEEDLKNTPKYTLAGDYSWEWRVDISEGLNKVSGGNYREAGWIDIDPARIQHYIEGWTGGLGRTTGNFATFLGQVFGEEEWKAINTPFLNKVLTITDERAQNKLSNSQFYAYTNAAEKSASNARAFEKDKENGLLSKEKASDEYKIYEIYTSRYKDAEKAYAKLLKVARNGQEEKRIKELRDANRKRFLRELSDKDLLINL